jgi:hypothetical protein
VEATFRNRLKGKGIYQKLIATRFRLYPFEWDMQRSTVIITDDTDKERNLYLQNLMNSVRAEIQQVGY